MTSAKRTAVCCLSSLNLDKFDEWKDTTLVQDLTRLLDNVIEYFIRLAPPELSKAVYSANKERAIGIGTLGFCSYLQSKRIPFESGGFNSAASETYRIYSYIKNEFIIASKQLATERGECSDCQGSGMRNSHGLAIAPNASSSDMVGVSPSREPLAANAFLSEGRAGSFLIKNHRLQQELGLLGLDTSEVWETIEKNSGSLKGLIGLPDWMYDVYKTFGEIDPKWVIELAAIAQEHVCQGMSTNIKVSKDITLQEMSDIHILAWVKGLKGMYYCRAEKPVQTNSIADSSQPLNKVNVEINFEECISCSG